MTAIAYTDPDDAAIVFNYDTTAITLGGINELKLPAGTRPIKEIREFRHANSKRTGELEIGTLTASGNYVSTDAGQKHIRGLLRDKTSFGTAGSEFRAYINLTDFLALDLIQESSSVLEVAKFEPGPIQQGSETVTYSIEITVFGMVATFDSHVSGDTLAFVAGSGSGDSITDSGSGFVTAGFAAGDTLIIEGATTSANDGQYEIASVAAGTITLVEDGELSAEAGVAGTALHGGLM